MTAAVPPVTPAAPVAPAPPAPQEPTGLAKAAAEGRAMLEERATARATEGATPGADPVHKETSPAAAPTAPAVTPKSPEGGEPEPEPEATPGGEEPAPGAGADPAGDETTIGLPGARAEDPVLEIVTSDPAIVERLNQLKNDGLRRQEMDRQMESVNESRAEIAAFEEAIATDPLGVISEKLSPRLRFELARMLLVDDDVVAAFAALSDEDPFAGAVSIDPANRALAVERMKNVRHELRDKLTGLQRARVQQHDFATKVHGALEKIVGNSMDEERREAFLDDALEGVRAYIRSHGGKSFELADLPLVLSKKLRLVGISPLEAERRLAATDTPTGSRPPASPAATPQAPKPTLTAAELRKKVVARAAAATIPSAAHGAPVASGQPAEGYKKGTGLKGALEAGKRMFARGAPKP